MNSWIVRLAYVIFSITVSVVAAAGPNQPNYGYSCYGPCCFCYQVDDPPEGYAVYYKCATGTLTSEPSGHRQPNRCQAYNQPLPDPNGGGCVMGPALYYCEWPQGVGAKTPSASSVEVDVPVSRSAAEWKDYENDLWNVLLHTTEASALADILFEATASARQVPEAEAAYARYEVFRKHFNTRFPAMHLAVGDTARWHIPAPPTPREKGRDERSPD